VCYCWASGGSPNRRLRVASATRSMKLCTEGLPAYLAWNSWRMRSMVEIPAGARRNSSSMRSSGVVSDVAEGAWQMRWGGAVVV
jgi:hypothetical protein